MDTRPRVICGFPGVGKTTLFKKLKDQGVLITDSDSSQFDKAHFPGNYIEHIKARLAEGFWVLCSTHTAVRTALAVAGISYVIAAPVHTYLKDEYMQRYRERGSPEPFLKLMDEKFDDFVKDVWADGVGLHFGLGEGEYLDRLGRDILKSDAGMKRLSFENVQDNQPRIDIGQPHQSADFAHAFQWGMIYTELRDAMRADTFRARTYDVHEKNVNLAQHLAAFFGILTEYVPTMNPQLVKVRFFKNLEVYREIERRDQPRWGTE